MIRDRYTRLALIGAAWAALLTGGGGRAITHAAQGPTTIQAVEGPLQDARRLFEATDWEGAEASLDRTITTLTGMTADATVREQLASAYELRARSRLNMGPSKRDAAVADVKSLFSLTPGYKLPPNLNPRVQAVFDEIRRTTVGHVALEVVPADASVTINSVPVTLGSEPVALTAGEYQIAASRAAHKAAAQSVVVVAGSSQPVRLMLERTSATASIVTIPHGVEVIVNNTPRGTTEPAVSPASAEWVAKYKVAATEFSKPLVLTDLGLGRYDLLLRRVCYTAQTVPIVVERLDDLRYSPIRLEPSVGTIQVDSTTGPATVILDGAGRGTTPVTLHNVCDGPHTVELRTDTGRMVRRLDVKPGQKIDVRGSVKPAFAIVSASGFRQQQRGGTDLRQDVERAFVSTASVTMFAAPPDVVELFLKEEGLDPSWLAFDRLRKPIGPTAAGLSESGRQELSAKLAKRLDVQGIAAVTVTPGGQPSDVLVTLLAAGSGMPDVIPVQLDDVQSTAQAVARLDRIVALYRPSIGALTIDVIDQQGVIVAAVEPNGPAAAVGLTVGDTIIQAQGRPVASVADLNNIVGTLQGERRMVVDLRDRTNTPKRVNIVASLVPRAVATSDRTLLSNNNVLDLRNRLTSAAPADEPIVRLNLGIALMGVRAWDAARRELESVRLPEGGGISNGTVQYLLGVCYDELRLFPESERAFRNAASSDALLTEDGAPVKEMAQAKLKLMGK